MVVIKYFMQMMFSFKGKYCVMQNRVPEHNGGGMLSTFLVIISF